MSFLEPLLQKAFGRAAARDANKAIEDARAQAGENAKNFEIIPPEEADARWLSEALLPRLVYHLESLGVRPPGYPGIFVTIFRGEDLFFVRTRDLMAFASQALGLTADQMYARWGTRELRHAVRKGDGPPPMLPPGGGR